APPPNASRTSISRNAKPRRSPLCRMSSSIKARSSGRKRASRSATARGKTAARADSRSRETSRRSASWRKLHGSTSRRNERHVYLEKLSLDGRTAVVTGGGQGIGLACAEALAEAGAHVVIADRDPRAAESGRSALAAKGYGAESVTLDVTDSSRVTDLADELNTRLGRVDILVNNAGIARSETPAERVTDE